MEKEILKLLKEMKSEMSEMNRRFDGVEKRLDSIDRRLDGVDQRLDGVDRRLDGMESTLKEHGQMLNAIEERTKVDSARIENLEYNMANVSGDIKGIKKSVSNISIITAQNWSDIEEIKKKIG